MIKQFSILLLVFFFSFNNLGALAFRGNVHTGVEKRLEKIEQKTGKEGKKPDTKKEHKDKKHTHT